MEYCDYNQINDKVLYFISGEGHSKYDRIFITDISINDEIANLIDKDASLRYKTNLIDHHATALPLAEKYYWCEVRVEESIMFPFTPEPPFKYSPRTKVLSSGTSLFYKFLRNKHFPKIERNEVLKIFADTVRKYDSWEWFNVYKDDHSKKLNDLLYIIGREKFVGRFSDNPNPIFNELEKTILEIEEHRINKYIWYKKQDVRKSGLIMDTEGESYLVGYVFAEQNVSLLGNVIAEENPDIDFVMIIDIGNSKVSLRGVKDNIHLGEIARRLGGGGHAKSAGFEIKHNIQKETFIKVFPNLFDLKEKNNK